MWEGQLSIDRIPFKLTLTKKRNSIFILISYRFENPELFFKLDGVYKTYKDLIELIN